MSRGLGVEALRCSHDQAGSIVYGVEAFGGFGVEGFGDIGGYRFR